MSRIESLTSLWNPIKRLPGQAWSAVKQGPAEAQKLVFGADTAAFKTRQVYDDPSDASAPSPDELGQASSEVKTHQAAETAALAKLAPEKRRRYEAVQALTTDNALARRALQKMLLDGRLTSQALVGSDTMLGALEHLGEGPLAPGVDRRQVVQQVLAEAENPVRINQMGKLTCGATTATILTARKNPAEYVRLIACLASPEGKVTLKGGATIQRRPDWQADNDGGRAVTARLLQPALMNLAEPLPGDSYDNERDYDRWGPVPLPFSGGLLASSQAKLDRELTGDGYDARTVFSWDRDARWNDVKSALAKGGASVPVGVKWNVGDGTFGHFVQVDKVEHGKVYITNPWGQRESFSEAEFKAHLTDIELPV